MAYETPTQEPESVTAGDLVTWLIALPDYPASTWTLSYRLINSAGKIDITAGASGDSHLVSVAAATSAGWTAGTYTWTKFVTSGLQRHTLASGSIIVGRNLAAEAAGYDTRSHAKKMLDAIEAALISMSSGERLAVVEAELATRRLKYDLQGLMKLRDMYRAAVNAELAAERINQGLQPRNKLLVRL